MQISAAIAICGMALATYLLRIGGLLAGSKLPMTPRWRTFLGKLPGAILISICVPGVLELGRIGFAAAALTILVSYWTRNVLAALITGSGFIALAYHLHWL